MPFFSPCVYFSGDDIIIIHHTLHLPLENASTLTHSRAFLIHDITNSHLIPYHDKFSSLPYPLTKILKTYESDERKLFRLKLFHFYQDRTNRPQ